MKKKIFIYGYGSIGARHAHIASACKANVTCISTKKELPFNFTQNIHTLISENNIFNLAIIATPTALHAAHLQEVLLTHTNKILVEKPLFSSAKETYAFTETEKKCIFIAYNLRFHPMIQRVKTLLEQQKILAIQAQVGQYLPTWRPNADYRNCYSAKKNLGGGVLRDLSHELDLVSYLAGTWEKTVALGGKESQLEIDSEDTVSILSSHTHCPQVTIHLDYLQNPARRHMLIIVENGSFYLDFITNTLSYGTIVEHFEVERDTTYDAQMRAFLSDNTHTACTFEQGLEIVKYIDAIEQSIENQGWIWNKNQ